MHSISKFQFSDPVLKNLKPYTSVMDPGVEYEAWGVVNNKIVRGVGSYFMSNEGTPLLRFKCKKIERIGWFTFSKEEVEHEFNKQYNRYAKNLNKFIAAFTKLAPKS